MPKAGLQIFHLSENEAVQVQLTGLPDGGCTLVLGNVRLVAPSLYIAERLLDGALHEVVTHKARLAVQHAGDDDAYDRAVGLDALVGF